MQTRADFSVSVLMMCAFVSFSFVGTSDTDCRWLNVSNHSGGTYCVSLSNSMLCVAFDCCFFFFFAAVAITIHCLAKWRFSAYVPWNIDWLNSHGHIKQSEWWFFFFLLTKYETTDSVSSNAMSIFSTFFAKRAIQMCWILLFIQCF